MANGNTYRKGLVGELPKSLASLAYRKKVTKELEQLGDAFAAVIGEYLKCTIEREVQNVPPLPSAVATGVMDTGGQMLVLKMLPDPDPASANNTIRYINIASCWFSSDSTKVCEIRFGEERKVCKNLREVKKALLEVARKRLASVIGEVEEELRKRLVATKNDNATVESAFLPTGNVEPGMESPTNIQGCDVLGGFNRTAD